MRLFVRIVADKVKKKYANLGHTIMMVQLERGGQGLGLSLAGHKDRNCMAVFVCGLNPTGAAFKAGSIQVGDEILEVSVQKKKKCQLELSVDFEYHFFTDPRISAIFIYY